MVAAIATLAACDKDPSGLTAQDTGNAPDAGQAEAPGCSLPHLQLAESIEHPLLQHAPIDLRVLDDRVYVAWIEDEDLSLATLSADGDLLGFEVIGQVFFGRTPRIFFREDGRPAVIVQHRSRTTPSTTVISVFDSRGAIEIVGVEGEVRFGVDASRPAVSSHPPLALAVRRHNSGSYLEVRANNSATPQRTEITELLVDYAIEIAPLDSGFMVLLGVGSDFERHTLDSDGVSAGPSSRLAGVKHLGAQDFRLRTDGGPPRLFLPTGDSRMASVSVLALDDSEGEPTLIQRRAGIARDFGIAVDRVGTEWLVAWSDFRDGFDQSLGNQYVERNLYFKRFVDGRSISDTAQLLVDGEGQDLAFPQIGSFSDGREVAAYLRGFARLSLHVVMGDFDTCPSRPSHPFQLDR